MADPSPSGVTSTLWRFSLALLVAALVLDFASHVVQLAWPWIVGTATFVAVVMLVVWWLRRDRGGW